jgi:hypothetical protein
MGEMSDSTLMTRRDAAVQANTEDAAVWRWFSELIEDRRIRYCLANGVWLVTVDHRHVGTSPSFDGAIRQAKSNSIARRNGAMDLSTP